MGGRGSSGRSGGAGGRNTASGNNIDDKYTRMVPEKIRETMEDRQDLVDLIKENEIELSKATTDSQKKHYNDEIRTLKSSIKTLDKRIDDLKTGRWADRRRSNLKK